MRSTKASIRVATTVGAAAVALLAWSAPAFANSDARVSGACDAGSTYELSAGPSGGDIRVTFKVSTPFSERDWTTTITDNGATVFTDTQFLPGGGFSYDVTTPDQPGPDTIVVDSAFSFVNCHATVTV